MTLQLVEQATTNIRNYLQANLNAEIDLVNTEHADAIAIAHVSASSYFFAEPDWLPQSLPAVILAPTDTILVEDWVNYFETRHRISLFLVDAIQDKQVLRQHLWRLTQATLRCLKKGRDTAAIGANTQLFFGDRPLVTYGPLYTPNKGEHWAQDVRIHLEALMPETAP